MLSGRRMFESNFPGGLQGYNRIISVSLQGWSIGGRELKFAALELQSKLLKGGYIHIGIM